MVDPRITYAAALVVAMENATGARWELDRVYEHRFVARRADWPAPILIDRGREGQDHTYCVAITFWQRGSVDVRLGETRIGSRLSSGAAVAARRVVAALPGAIAHWDEQVVEDRKRRGIVARAESVAREIGVLIGGVPRRSQIDHSLWLVSSAEGLQFEVRDGRHDVLVGLRHSTIGEQLALALARAHRDHDREGRAAS